MDKKLYLVKDMSAGDDFFRAYSTEAAAMEQTISRSAWEDKRETTFGIIEWDEYTERGRCLALIFRGVVYTPQPGDTPKLGWY